MSKWGEDIIPSSELLDEVEREELKIKARKYEILKEKIELEEGLPFLYGWPWYKWAKKVFDSRNKEILLTAANQISKSSTAIRKNIHWATDVDNWPLLWPSINKFQRPLFWYFYPSFRVATTEFEQKWHQFLPQGRYREHPVYGWTALYAKREISELRFNSGVTIQFKTYEQKENNLQASSVYMVTCDEELPVHLLPEIKARLNATDGYFLMVFTATLGQEYWRQAMEPLDKEEERHKDALKLQVSLYDCLEYEDGSPTPWTHEKIKRAIANCPTEAEVQRRVMGRFVKSEGLLLESFSVEKNTKEFHPVPKNWLLFSGVDPGSGGSGGHPAAICFVAVNPDYTQGRVYKTWRGDGESTTSDDILRKWRELRGSEVSVVNAYDYAAKDFYTVATRNGESFIPAEKSRGNGYDILNTLFKRGALVIYRNYTDNDKLIAEIMGLSVDQTKKHAKDDLIDAMRYAVMSVPWDFSNIRNVGDSCVEEKEDVIVQEKTDSEYRRDWFMGKTGPESLDSIEAEIDYWSSMHCD